jgi:uncharacterized membrane protein
MKDVIQPGRVDAQPDKLEVQSINKVVTTVLAVGMYATVGSYLIGLVLLFAKGDLVPEISKQYFHSFGSLVSGILSLNPRAFLYTGTITLILTPISRVLISIFAFWKEKDKKFVFVTMVVFVVILAGVIAGMVFKINVG